MSAFPLLTVLTLVPLAGGLMLLGVSPRNRRLARGLALVFSLVGLALAAGLWTRFDTSVAELQFVERHPWIPTLGIDYFVGVDGLGMLMVLLTALVVPVAIVVSWKIEEKVPLYFALMLWLQSGLFGTFTALNFFHWFLFWELSLVPAFFLVKLWGGTDRGPAATQFFIYTMLGSVTMLLSFLAIYLATGTFDFIKLAELGRTGQLASALSAKLGWYNLTAHQLSVVIFSGVLLGFAVKVPLMPFHTWLPVTYAEAPTGTTMLLTGVMSKMGVYGLLRILLPLFPQQMRMVLTPLLWLAVITIVFSASAALAQKDLKRVFAYSSINHLGYCLLGVFAVAKLTGNDPRWSTEKAAALNGVLVQMFNHGLTASTLFCFVGFLEHRAGGRRGLEDFGGLRKVAPVFCGLMGIALFASLGLPGLNGFVGEFLIFKGAFALTTWAAVLAVIGLLVTAIFMLGILQRVFSGPLNGQWTGFADLTTGERLTVLPATLLMFAVGLYPQWILGVTNPTVQQWVAQLKF
ncbi:MAG: NADH-quinone oxidoreductase subunit M [Verrucomicrobia bacterium]|nr:NADH-quinone oxidoreductase subunit M [Verrucomicrobiota bacterium]